MRTEAYAKVNLTLEVFTKRVDGYHALRSVVMPVSLSDTLEISPGADGTITSDTGYADDLCVKAARVLREAADPRAAEGGCRISVTKRIPAGGGLGGGSADAAAVLLALNRLWQVGLPLAELAQLGAAVGSDVPALVLAQGGRGPVLMEGRGEIVSPLPCAAEKPIWLVLANPGVFSSTPEVFRASVPRVTDEPSILYNMRIALESGDPTAVAAALQNDLEAPACSLHPEIVTAKAALREAGAAGCLMSGSGSTVFGVVPTEAAGREIAASLSARGLTAWVAHTIVR